MNVWIVRILGWAAAVLVVVIGLIGRDPEVGDRSTERLRTYEVPVDGTGALALPVRASAQEIRVRWWLEDPGWGPPDDRHTRPARVAARLVPDDGPALFAASTWLLFRRRPIAQDAGIAARERLGSRRAAPLSDPRVWRFSLPERAEPATLELTVLDAPPGARLFAAVWAGTPAEPVLSAEGQGAEPGLDWARLSALAGGGRSFSAQVIEAALSAEVPPPGATATVVPPGGAVAFNLEDARAVLHAEWWALDGSGPLAARATVQTPRGLERTSSVAMRAVPGEAPATVAIVLDPSESPRLLRAWTEGEAPVSWGTPPSAPDGIGRSVGPELVRGRYVRVGPAADATWAVNGGETLRIVARPRLGPGSLPGLAEPAPEGVATVTLAYADDAGIEVGRAIWTAPRVPDAWDRYGSVDTPLTARVGRPTAGRVLVPDSARTLQIKSDETVDLAVWVPSGLPDEPHPAYPWDPERHRARSVPRRRSPWRLRGPEQPDALLAAARLVDVDAMVRIESLPGESDEPEPQASRSRRSVALGSLSVDRPYGWLLVPSAGRTGAAGRARIGPSPRLLEPGPDGSVLVEARRAPERVGAPIRLRVEGRDLTLRARATASTHRLTGLPSPFVIAVSDPGLFVVPQAGGELRKLRAWRLDPGESLALDIPPDGGRLVVQAWGDGLSWQVDGELRAGEVYGALPVVSGVLGRGQGASARVFSEAGGVVPGVMPWRRTFAPEDGPRRVVLVATGVTWVRPLASWGSAKPDDEERIWWLPEPIAVAEVAP